MPAKTNDIRAQFLKHIEDSSMPVTVFLTNGVKLSGVISLFDDDSMTLTRDGFTQLIQRHAVATILPQQPFLPTDFN